MKEYYFSTKEPEQIEDELFFKDCVYEETSGDNNSKIGYAFHPDMLLHKHKS